MTMAETLRLAVHLAGEGIGRQQGGGDQTGQQQQRLAFADLHSPEDLWFSSSNSPLA